ncbi:putative ama1 protein [Trypanosoma cruzi]|nr:putative ama1 protein [Trypanosoma cruzi]
MELNEMRGPGVYAAAQGGDSAQKWAPGVYTAAQGGDSAQKWAPGVYTAAQGGDSAQKWAPGVYAAAQGGDSAQKWPPGVYMPNPAHLAMMPPPPLRDWRYGLCHCCADCSPCLESWCCYYCQLSRQYNVHCDNGKPEINWLVALGSLLGDYCCFGLVSTVLHFLVRNKIRRDFNIQGSDCGDGCVVFCCSPCGLQQMLMELTELGKFPGACCYDAPPPVVPMQ